MVKCVKDSIKSCEAPLIKATQEIIRIKSVKSDPQPGMPFGPGPAAALKYALDLAESFGFETKNLDNYAGWAQWGQGEEMIGVLAHLDVVPEGSDWTYPPYGGEIHDGKIYGRGAIDDKGPAMAALFALKALRDSGIKPRRRVRVIFGTDEESGSQCMEYYKKHDELPTMGFSPDADFPIINAEKGILTFEFNTKFQDAPETGIEVVSLQGGHRPNMVPDFAKAELKGDKTAIIRAVEAARTDGANFSIEDKGDTMEVNSIGVSAHGSTPEEGKNAVMHLAQLLSTLDLAPSQGDFIKFLDKFIGLDTSGLELGINLYDEKSGALTLNVGIANMDRESASVVVNIRYPISFRGEDILQKIRENTPESISVVLKGDDKPHYVPEDNPMIQKLKSAYEEVTGEKAYCISIGGGTYARLFENCVAFGPSFPGDPELAHQRDEYIEVDGLIKNLWIYAKVLEYLVKE
jgi:succinyl-diaminopimelate desuccinylase